MSLATWNSTSCIITWMHICRCVCVCVHGVSIPVCPGICFNCPCARGSHRPTLAIFLYCSLPEFFKTVSHWTQSSQCQLKQLAKESLGHARLCLLTLGLQACTIMSGFIYRWWESELRSSHLHSTHVTQWAISPSADYKILTRLRNPRHA